MADGRKAERVAQRMEYIRLMLDEGDYDSQEEHDELVQEYRLLSQWLLRQPVPKSGTDQSA